MGTPRLRPFQKGKKPGCAHPKSRLFLVNVAFSNLFVCYEQNQSYDIRF